MLSEQVDAHARAAREHASLPPRASFASARSPRACPRFLPRRGGCGALLATPRGHSPARAGHSSPPAGAAPRADPGPLSSFVPTVCPRTPEPRPATRRAGCPARPAPTCAGAAAAAAAPPPRGELRAWPLPLHPPPLARAAPSSGPGGTAQARVRVPGRRSPAPRPPPPSPALSLQTPESRRAPGAAERRPATRSALTWKCSAIFPGGGAGPRPREPEGRERRRAPRSPSRPRGPCAAGSRALRLSREASAFQALDGAGPDAKGRGDGAGAGPRKAGPGPGAGRARESQLSPALDSTAVTSSLCPWAPPPAVTVTPGSSISHRFLTPNPMA